MSVVGRGSGPAALAAGVLAGALCAGCASAQSLAGPAVPVTTTPGATLSSEPSPVGRILATGAGATLYEFAPDTAGRSTCVTPICVTLWPPLLAHGTPRLGPGVRRALVGTIRRSDGSLQLTYGGHPLYTWRGDRRPGTVTGQALLNAGGYWYVVSVSGRAITTPFSVGGPGSPSPPD